VLRLVECRDLPRLAALRADVGLQHLLMANPAEPTVADPLAELYDWVKRREAAGVFRIIAGRADEALGFLQIADIHRKNRLGWLGIALLPEARGAGNGRAALAEAEALAFSDTGLRKLILIVRADNGPAIALYDSAGWRKVGHLEAQYDDGRVLHDALVFEKLLGKL